MSAADAEPRPGLHRQAIRLEQFTVAWMLIEAGVAVTAGIIAGSLALTSFGFDSVIELVSATLVLRRLQAELAHGQSDQRAERRVLRIIAVTFFLVAAYVMIGSGIDLATGARPERSPVGIGLTVAALLVMPLLGWRKRRAGTLLSNQLVLADAAETILCATLAATTLLGLVLFAAFGWWWADPIAAWPSPTSPCAKAAKPGTASWPAMTDTLPPDIVVTDQEGAGHRGQPAPPPSLPGESSTERWLASAAGWSCWPRAGATVRRPAWARCQVACVRPAARPCRA